MHGVDNNRECKVAGCPYTEGGLVLESKVCTYTGGGDDGGTTSGWDDFWTNNDTTGGTGPAGTADPIVSSPNVPTTGQLLAIDVGNLLDITDPEILAWIKHQPNWSKSQKIKDYIDDNSCGLESGNQTTSPCQMVYDFSAELLTIMMDIPGARFNDALQISEVYACLGTNVILPLETMMALYGYLITDNACSEPPLPHDCIPRYRTIASCGS